ncbi:MAG TPA: ABC transporter substrate-binding protein [Pseudonocardiaceae bacterium]
MRTRNPLLIALLAVLAIAGCTSTPTTTDTAVPAPVSRADLAKVTLRVGDQKGGSQSLLAAAGLLNTPYHLQWSTFTSGPPLLEAVNAGAIDIGGVGNTPPLFSAAANAKIAVVAAAQGPVAGDTILVPKNSPIHTLADLRGRTIAVAKGSSAHGHLLLALKKAGLTQSDATISYLQPADAYAAFSQRQVDAWAIWDPYTSQALQLTGARILVDGTGTIGGAKPGTSAPTNGSALSNGYEFQVASRAALAGAGTNSAIRDYLLRLAKASTWASSHLSAWAAVWARQTGLAAGVADAAVVNTTRRPVPLTAALVTSEQNLADSFVAAKVLPTEFTFADYVDHRFDADIAAYVRNEGNS